MPESPTIEGSIEQGVKERRRRRKKQEKEDSTLSKETNEQISVESIPKQNHPEPPREILYSKPLKEIVSWPVHVNELYLGCKGIEELKDFEQFPNLHELWLNGNKITDIANLKTNIRLKKLYLHDNAITDLDVLSSMKHLEILLLQNNQITNLMETGKKLAHLTHLRRLNLFGNPIALEENYRKYIISLFPNLEVFDRREVKENEKASKPRNLNSSQVLSTPPPRKLEKNLQKEVNRIKKNKIQIEQEELKRKQELERERNETLPLPIMLDFLSKKL